MSNRALFLSLTLACASSVFASADPMSAKSPAHVGVPPNTIDCRDWTDNHDGTWTAHANAKPFDLAKSRQITVADSIISHRAIGIDGYDLAVVLDEKCGR